LKIEPGRYYWTRRGKTQRVLAFALSAPANVADTFWALVRLYSPRRRQWLKMQSLPPELFLSEAKATDYAVRYALTRLPLESISRAPRKAAPKKGRNHE
jgi:hypothetical protein